MPERPTTVKFWLKWKYPIRAESPPNAVTCAVLRCDEADAEVLERVLRDNGATKVEVARA